MSEHLPSPEDKILQWITSKWMTKPIHIVAELGIADFMCDIELEIEGKDLLTIARKAQKIVFN